MSSYEKPDYWALKAQKEGYPARSVYKLQEIEEKFSLFKGAGTRNADQPFRVLDIGAAPGSWSLYVLRQLGKRVRLVAIDLAPLSRQHDRGLFDGENFYFIQGDIMDSSVRETVLARGPYDLVISDVAPATTGSRTVDTLRSQALVEEVVAYALAGLVAGGNLVVKVFQGGNTVELLKVIREHFSLAKSFKPQACRAESFETYYIGLGYRGKD
ncbi:RlmE family RNA methyltransferase [Treponema sp. J25]|uniref:SAM-dependent methyltransferase n=1 Tax=Treponema sp. J25 TaxID=2094121 RepID=UPI00104AAF92|nr:RlmE family RNA methyltransferase [Treponema sp. J25]TCW61224.1 50S rRNA methyltransferase [Treponema sp. J25]